MPRELKKPESVQFIGPNNFGYDPNIARFILQSIQEENLEAARDSLLSLHVADLAAVINQATHDQRAKITQIVRNNIDPMLLVELDEDVREEIIKLLGYKHTAALLSKLDIDDIVYAIMDIDENVASEVLPFFSKTKREELEELLSYPEESAGRIMQKQFISVSELWNVAQVHEYIRSKKKLPNDFYEIYVIDAKYKVLGTVSLATLMKCKPETVLKEIMKTNFKTVHTGTDQEDVYYLFKQYGLVSVPVINKNSRIVGIITIDDAMDIMEEEAEKDLLQMGGVHETDFHHDLLDVVKCRFPWLFINLFTASLVMFTIHHFETTIHHLMILSAIMPVVASMGGNAGTQTLTVSVFAINTKELTIVNAMRSVTKQVMACMINGVLLAIIGAILIYFWTNNSHLSAIFGGAVIINFILAGFFGSAIPITLNMLKVDPAVASPIFLTALTDICGFITFLGLAKLFLL